MLKLRRSVFNFDRNGCSSSLLTLLHLFTNYNSNCPPPYTIRKQLFEWNPQCCTSFSLSTLFLFCGIKLNFEIRNWCSSLKLETETRNSLSFWIWKSVFIYIRGGSKTKSVPVGISRRAHAN